MLRTLETPAKTKPSYTPQRQPTSGCYNAGVAVHGEEARRYTVRREELLRTLPDHTNRVVPHPDCRLGLIHSTQHGQAGQANPQSILAALVWWYGMRQDI